jgi:peptidoglycan/xylan/chitin deacetylase (PgdA/CDA1 family)
MPRLDRLLTLYAFSALRKVVSAKNPSIPILMYHSISDEPESGHPYFWINTSRNRFAEQMQFLKENAYTVISLTEAVDVLETGQDKIISSRRYVVLTFDDGYHDFLEHAWPVLAGNGFTATMFVSTAFIGDRRMLFNGRESLTWSEVRKLRGQGVSFGSHTMSHPKLYGLPWKDVRRELLDSRLRLEDELQTAAPCFAYPHAFPQEDRSFVARFRQELIDQGYRTAVTTAIGLAQQGSDPLCLKRLPVNEGDDERLLRAKLAGAYDWLYGAQYLSRRIKSKVNAKMQNEDLEWY